jgi:hypothetical protein
VSWYLKKCMLCQLSRVPCAASSRRISAAASPRFRPHLLETARLHFISRSHQRRGYIQYAYACAQFPHSYGLGNRHSLSRLLLSACLERPDRSSMTRSLGSRTQETSSTCAARPVTAMIEQWWSESCWGRQNSSEESYRDRSDQLGSETPQLLGSLAYKHGLFHIFLEEDLSSSRRYSRALCSSVNLSLITFVGGSSHS